MRLLTIAFVLFLCAALGGSSAFANDEVLQNCIKKGLEYLDNTQDPRTGALGEQNKLATTSLAGMAFLSGGNLPGRGLYGKNVEMAIRFVLDNATTPSGYLQFQSSNMYSHGLAMLFLAEVYGSIPPYMDIQPKVRKALMKSVDLLERCQGPEGGWWYEPAKDNRGNGSDISITVCETNALRAARNSGIAVDKRVIENALQCVRKAQNADGGFCYRVYVDRPSGGGSLFPRSAGAVCILQALGAVDSPEAKKGLEYLVKKTESGEYKSEADMYPLYARYYASQAMFMAGDEYWAKWWPKVKADLLGLQQPDGSWQGEGGKGYGTAVALIILQMPYRFLPIYQEGIEK